MDELIKEFETRAKVFVSMIWNITLVVIYGLFSAWIIKQIFTSLFMKG